MIVRITPEFPELVITDCGRVRGPSGKWLAFFPDHHGYLQFNVHRRPVRLRLTVHNTVCTAFHGPRPDGLIVRHLDGNMVNNHADNLTWGTQEENEADKRLHGTAPQGENHGAAKLAERDVIYIREAIARGVPVAVLARKFDVVHSTIGNIKDRKTWRHI